LGAASASRRVSIRLGTELAQRGSEKKLDVDIAPYVILGACNPQLAHAALTEEPGIGLLLPCNVVLAVDGADVIVSAASPKAMFSVVKASNSIAAIAADAEQRLRRALERI